jgi:hypothetical protein
MIEKNNIFKTRIILTAILFFLLIVPFITRGSLVGNTNNAVLSFSPNFGVYRTNSPFPVDILLNTSGQRVVVAAAYFNYDPSKFQVVSVDTSGSIFSMEAESNITVPGTVKISRGSPTPGVNTTNGRVATVYLKGLTDTNPSSDNITFNFTAGSTLDSNVILDDSLGTDILSGVNNALFSLDGTPPANVSNFKATPGSGSIALSWTNPTVDFNGVAILRRTDRYPTSPTDGTIVYDSAGNSYTDIGLTVGLVYYYTAFSRDIVLNYSSGAQVSASLLDQTAPSAINNLSSSSITSNSVLLNWTAVGDDGNVGTANSYDIRYSTNLITSSNWSSATQVTGEPSPKVSGSSESMTVSGLNDNTIYYFAIIAIDESNNSSPLSNVINFTTYKKSDFNRDRIVNSVDFGIMMSYWNSTSRPPADINQDGIVNSADFAIMMSQWG